jgi:adenylyl-sulfate kinase
MMSNHTMSPFPRISQKDRERRQAHQGATIWLTGLSGAGKSTLAQTLEYRLFASGHQVIWLDGDDLRTGLNTDLGYSLDDRRENVRRTGEMARLLTSQGMIVIVALISPMRADRDAVRARFTDNAFIEVWCDTPLSVCEQRDCKGLYARARAGELPMFTGISSPYEPPHSADFQTGMKSPNDAADGILALLADRGITR